jgi:hypothetical protein
VVEPIFESQPTILRSLILGDCPVGRSLKTVAKVYDTSWSDQFAEKSSERIEFEMYLVPQSPVFGPGPLPSPLHLDTNGLSRLHVGDSGALAAFPPASSSRLQ